jgi:hypothetical protein
MARGNSQAGQTMQSKSARKYKIITGFALYTAVLIAGIIWLTAYQFASQPEEHAPAGAVANGEDRHYGRITMGISSEGCRQLRFNNNTGELQETDSQPCSAAAPGVNSTEGRLNAIRGAFSKK